MHETELQLAASRQLTAQMHNALKAARDLVAGLSTSASSDEARDQAVAIIDEALDYDEPSIKAALADADHAVKVRRLVKAARAVQVSREGNRQAKEAHDLEDALKGLA
jgi:hypothetical protein